MNLNLENQYWFLSSSPMIMRFLSSLPRSPSISIFGESHPRNHFRFSLSGGALLHNSYSCAPTIAWEHPQTPLYDRWSLGRTRRAANATRSATVSDIVTTHDTAWCLNTHQHVLFLPSLSCSGAATLLTGAIKHRGKPRTIILRLICFVLRE